MVAYKLIKEYPLSVGLGTIVRKHGTNLYIDKISKRGFYKAEIEEHPEFWEKFEEEYEILSFKGTLSSNSNGLFIKNDTKFYWKGETDWLKSGIPGIDEEFLLKNGSVTINSIKRLADEEVFSLGDKIQLGNYSVAITNISLDDKIQYNWRREVPYLECEEDFGASLSTAKKAKQALFTTKDGIEIFEGGHIL